MLLIDVAILVLGFIVLSFSAKQAIRRLVHISHHFGVSEFIISFVLVGVLSTFPELSIGVNSALQGSSSLGLGVVLGSNVADLTIVLGTIAIIAKGIRLKRPTVRQTKWFLLGVLLPVILLVDGMLSRVDGIILACSFFIYLIWMVTQKRDVANPRFNLDINLPVDVVVLIVSVFLLAGSGWLITQATESISTALRIPLLFIGMVVAIGTCLPEFTFALHSARKGHAELAFGDILGNVFADCMMTLGIVALVHPIVLTAPLLALTSGFFMAFAMAAVVILLNGKDVLERKDGVLLVMFYLVFVALQTFLQTVI